MSADILALVTLTLMEIVLGIDNIIFLAIVAGRVPREQQARARRIGLVVALGTRLALLAVLFKLTELSDVIVFHLSSLGLPEGWLPEKVDAISIKDLVLLVGGAFLIGKSTVEIHHKLEGDEEEHGAGGTTTFASAIVQIALLDIVFSLDSVITAIGMASKIWVMVVAMCLAVGVMLIFAGRIADFVARHPTIKILALAFLILIGVMLVAEGLGQHISKGYIYFAMAFSVVVELLNLRVRAKRGPVELRDDKMPPDAASTP
jgi:predicted tellurium resistance membrane protein TerC